MLELELLLLLMICIFNQLAQLVMLKLDTLLLIEIINFTLEMGHTYGLENLVLMTGFNYIVQL